MGKRAGSDEAAQLLTCNKAGDWQQAFDSYGDAINRLSQEKGRADLAELDRWWREELPLAIRTRGANAHLTQEELVKVVQWKLWIGKVRPNLLRFAKEADPSQVEAKSQEAFECLPLESSNSKRSCAKGRSRAVSRDALKKASTILTSGLRGVGPATASAVLAAGCGGCPFDADEVIDSVMKTGVRKYDLPEYLKVHEALTSKAAQLGSPWDAERVRRALWARAICSRFDLKVEGKKDHAQPSAEKGAESNSEGGACAGVNTSSGTAKSKRTRARAQDAGETVGSHVGKQAARAKRRRKS